MAKAVKKAIRKSAPKKHTVAQEARAVEKWKKASLAALHKQLGIKKKRSTKVSVRAKRNPVERWLLIAHVPAKGVSKARKYYYTESGKFDSLKAMGKHFATLGDAREKAQEIKNRLPKNVEALEMARA